MTFDTITPNAGQSPGLFPSGNNTNFVRLKAIINADHIFNDTAQADDGCHRQMTMAVLSADPVTLPAGTSGLIYLKIVSGAAQIFFYNGVAYQQITPFETLLPIRVAGSVNLAAGASSTIYSPSFNWVGTAWAILGDAFRFYNVIRNNAFTDTHELDSASGALSRPTLSFSGTSLRITNNEGSAQTVSYSLIVNRLA